MSIHGTEQYVTLKVAEGDALLFVTFFLFVIGVDRRKSDGVRDLTEV